SDLVARRRLARAGSLRHVRHHVQGTPRSAAHPDVGDVRRGLSAPQKLPVARTLLAGRAGPSGAERQSRSALLAGRAVDRRCRRRLAGRYPGTAATRPAGCRAGAAPVQAMSKRTVELDLATPGVDAQGHPTRVPLTATSAEEPDLRDEHLLVNIGPQHPATHGVLRLVVELDGETVVRCIPHLGYLHSGFEKLGEYRHYNQIIPLTDRTDRKSTRLNSSHDQISYAVFCL